MPIADAARGIRHLFVHDLVLACRIGVYPREHGRAQRVRLNLDLGVAEAGPMVTDQLADVVDYEALVERVRAALADRHVNLVETLAEQIAALCLEDPRVRSARVRVEKLDAIEGAEAVGVEIERLNRRPGPTPGAPADAPA
jgi:7,8-dihydroneopterin aldolase/epimerase/oxygenase